jgi:hypothetical protein
MLRKPLETEWALVRENDTPGSFKQWMSSHLPGFSSRDIGVQKKDPEKLSLVK